MMNRKKIIGSVVIVAMLVGAVGASIYGVENRPLVTAETVNATESNAPGDVNEILQQVQEEVKATGNDLSKEETVYVIADAQGEVDKIIVSDWIQNGTADAKIEDHTELQNIKNVKGDEGYTMGGDNTCVWDAKGHDIYYQGTTDKKLPVDVKVSYSLDGQSISADEIAGKSGKVTIRFDYTNNETKTMKVGGKDEKIYVPFAMLTGMIMDNKVFSNIEVTNGKIVNEGEKTIVTGLAFPGLSEDLGVKSGSEIEIPSYFEITADAKNFAMKNTVTIATNSIFDGFDTSKIDSTSLKDGIDKLNDGMDKLIDGSSELYDGIETLLDKSKELVVGIRKLADASKKLAEGAKKVDDSTNNVQNGAGALAAGVDKLKSEGTTALSAGASNLATGAEQLVEGARNAKNGIDQVSGGLETLKGNSENLNQLATGLDGGLDTALNGIDTLIASLDPTADAATIAGLNNIKTGLGTAKGYSSTLASSLPAYTAGVDAAAAGATQLKGGAESLILGVEALSEGASDISTGAANLDAKTAELQAGAQQLYGGTQKLKTEGTKPLAEGAEELYKGIMKLDESAPLLIEGVDKLAGGSMELCDGLKKFRDEGISKLTEILDGDLGNIADRLNVTVDAAKSYNSFTGLGEGMNGSTKFIYKTEEIKSNN